MVSLQITFCRLDHMYGILLAGVGGEGARDVRGQTIFGKSDDAELAAVIDWGLAEIDRS